MRLDEINSLRKVRSASSQPLYPAPTDRLRANPPSAYRASIKRRLVDRLSGPLFSLQANQSLAHMGLGPLPGVTHVHVGYRFASGWYSSRLLSEAKPSQHTRVLLPGCHFNSQEVRDWLAMSVGSVSMLDIVDWGPSYDAVKQQFQSWYRPTLDFIHGTLDRIPLPDSSFDLIVSRAVLEHVGNMEDSVREMARVLKPGGIAAHAFGPLYFVHGGDHTIGSYGFEHGFDHILLDERDYQDRISDTDFYRGRGTGADHSRYWALQGIFSYLRPLEYLEIFQRYFKVRVCVAIVSNESLTYRALYPSRWTQMLELGLQPSDLLVASMQVVLEKRGSRPD